MIELKIEGENWPLTDQQESLLRDIMGDEFDTNTVTLIYRPATDLYDRDVIEVVYTPTPRDIVKPPYKAGQLVKVDGIIGHFRVMQWGVVGTNSKDQQIVITNEHIRPSNTTLNHLSNTWPRGLELYYCNDKGQVERKWRKTKNADIS